MTAPARLQSVRLQGFKSFADRTLVSFGPGISAIVGPNGSGKSNLADALRWALGEQGRALRSRKSEDVIWAGSERRPAVGMADVQLTLDNSDGLLPVDYGVVELGRRLYRSGENDYLLNRQRVRLKDLVDLLDAAHLAENAFLFIGQGMVDQALALRPEERRPLFEEVAGVRRHERRRRRAEEQLAESEANLARADDILAELRPQVRRLAQQAEQQANRLTAADELAAAILLSAHARWHAAARRAVAGADVLALSRGRVETALAELLEHERAISAAGEALAGGAIAEADARSALDRVRVERAALQLREGRHASESSGAARERATLDASRAEAETDLAAGRLAHDRPLPVSPTELEAELATLDAELAATRAGRGGGTGLSAAVVSGLSAVDAAAVRRLEAARAADLAAARRRAAEADRLATEELARAEMARVAAASAADRLAEAARDVAARRAGEASAVTAREAMQASLAEAESTVRLVTDRAAGARASLAAATARHDEAKRALEAAEGARFSRAVRARGGRAIGDGVVIEPTLQRAVDAALAGLGRALVLPRAQVAAVAEERGVVIVAEAVAAATTGRAGADGAVAAGGAAATSDAAARSIVDAARARGGGPLVEAVRRDDAGAVTRLLGRAVWLPDDAACLELQASLPAGWIAVARGGALVVGEIATWLRPEGRDLHLRTDAARLATELAAATAAAEEADAARGAGERALSTARSAYADAREREARETALRRRAEELERAANGAVETARREAAWLAAQAEHRRLEASRLHAGIPDEAATDADPAAPGQPATEAIGATQAAQAARDEHDRRLAGLARQRAELAEELEAARTTRLEAERARARAEAAVALAERELARVARATADLAEREAQLSTERGELLSLVARAEHDVTTAAAALAEVSAAAGGERDRLRQAELAASAARERVRIAQERSRLDEREDLEARLAVDGLRDQLLVELAGLGPIALRHLGGARPTPVASRDEELDGPDDVDPEAMEAALAEAAVRWSAEPPAGEPPPIARLATLRRRLHDLGAVNPFAAEEHAEVKARLDVLEQQRADLQSAKEHTRELIRELDRLIADQFRRTFDALERAFDRRFQQLFGGGFARLSLTDPEDLSATGVEITARPPGKKAQALAMLSGGERSLTAVALLFAMLEVRPVPFCVLDEVDAALDEANIGRFTEALRELAQGTQCIVITHNRGTIETADALYGVTVGDDSVSRVISLRLDEATALAGRRNGSGGTETLDDADPASAAVPASEHVAARAGE